MQGFGGKLPQAQDAARKNGSKTTIGRRRLRPALRAEGGSFKQKKSPAATYFRATKALSSAQEGLTSVFGMGTGIAPPPWPPDEINSLIRPRPGNVKREGKRLSKKASKKPPRHARKEKYGQASRPISSARLCASPRLRLRPIDPVLSRGPSEGSSPLGCLVLRRASRLDAFSGYPFPAWLPSACPWQDNWHARGRSTPVLSY